MRFFGVLFATFLLCLLVFAYPLCEIYTQKNRQYLPDFISENLIIDLSEKFLSNFKDINPLAHLHYKNVKADISYEISNNFIYQEHDEDIFESTFIDKDFDTKPTFKPDQNKSIEPAKEFKKEQNNTIEFKKEQNNTIEFKKEQNNTIEQIKKPIYEKEISHKNGVLLIGDSLMQGVGMFIKADLLKAGFKVTDLSKISTGLINKKYFNWENKLKTALQNDKNIAFVVALFGANDTLDFKKDGKRIGIKNQQWNYLYKQRIFEITKQIEYDQKLVWIGLPCMRDKEFDAKMQNLNKLYEDVIFENINLGKNYEFMDIKNIFCVEGRYKAFISSGKKELKTRAPDGIHFTPNGYKMIGKKVLDIIKASYTLD